MRSRRRYTATQVEVKVPGHSPLSPCRIARGSEVSDKRHTNSNKGRSGMLRAETVRVELSERITADQLAVGTQLPSEPKLAAELGVSRATVRDALRALEQEGLVRRVQGSGTYVAHPRVPNSLDMNFGVTAAI